MQLGGLPLSLSLLFFSLTTFVFAASDLLLKWRGSLARWWKKKADSWGGGERRLFFSVPHVKSKAVCVVPILFAASVVKIMTRESRPAKQHFFFFSFSLMYRCKYDIRTYLYTSTSTTNGMKPRFHCCSNERDDEIHLTVFCNLTTWAPAEGKLGKLDGKWRCRTAGVGSQGSRDWAVWQSTPLDLTLRMAAGQA